MRFRRVSGHIARVLAQIANEVLEGSGADS